jgi:Leucine-rich repeat (LRR) protein
MNDLNKIKSDIKSDLINYFDGLKFDIDIKAQEILCNESLADYFKEHILKLNMDLMDKIDEIFNNNMNLVNNYFESHKPSASENQESLDKEKMKMKIINSYCYFINNDLLKKKINPLGLLIITDWYLDDNQINYLKVKYQEDSPQLKLIKFCYDENILNLNIGIYMKNFEDDDESVDDNVYLSKEKIIKELKDVEHLDLSGIKLFIDKEVNFLKTIKNTTLENVKHLRIVKLHGKVTENNILTNLNKLEHLNMTGLTEDMFKSILDDLKNTSSIEKLILQNGQIRCIQENPFDTLNKLKELDLSNNLIESLNDKIFQPLENLTRMVLRINRISEIKENTFKNLKNLKELDLSKNKIKSIDPNAFIGLNNLERLILSINSLKQLNKNIFKYFIKLEELDMSYNLLESLNDCQFDGMINLKFLNLYQNVCLGSLSLKTFSGLSNLESLDMSYCSMENLPDNVFIDLKNLKELSLGSTSIKMLTKYTFNGLSELIRLNLSNTNLEYIDNDAFKWCDKLFHQKDEELRIY